MLLSDKSTDNIAPVPMFSKIGRYISQKIVRIDKSQNSRKNRTPNSSHDRTADKENTLGKDSASTPHFATIQTAKHHTPRVMNRSQEFQPCVGHYKVKFSTIDKNLPRVNFKKFLPHFSQDKIISFESEPVVKDVPQGVQRRVLGFQQLKRMTSRQQIKGSIRHEGENPHQRRFEAPYDSNYWTDSKHVKVANFDKILKRNNLLFKSLEFSPDYDVNTEYSKKKLATHIIHFEKQLPRGDEYILNKVGLSEQFDEHTAEKPKDYTVRFDRLLPRYTQSDLPSYLDKNINSRAILSSQSWKTLKMNCSESYVNGTK